MKKALVIFSALTLAACTVGYETDIDRAAAKREANIDARHQINGCTFVRDHEAYKTCIMNTYKLNSPATYTTQNMQDGRPVAVFSQGQPASSACGLKPIPKQQEYEWAAPTTVSQTNSVETVCQKRFEPQQTVIQTVEETIPPPTPEVIFVQQEPVAPVVVAAPPQPKWTAPVQREPVCPCADPNDPCPQCYDK